jgi:hypothetical protein
MDSREVVFLPTYGTKMSQQVSDADEYCYDLCKGKRTRGCKLENYEGVYIYIYIYIYICMYASSDQAVILKWLWKKWGMTRRAAFNLLWVSSSGCTTPTRSYSLGFHIRRGRFDLHIDWYSTSEKERWPKELYLLKYIFTFDTIARWSE